MNNQEAIHILSHLYAENHIIYDPNLKEICISKRLAQALDKAILCLYKEEKKDE